MRRHHRARTAAGVALVLVAGLVLTSLVGGVAAATPGPLAGAGAAGASGSPSGDGAGGEVQPVRFEPVAAESVDARHPGSITGTPLGDVVVGLVAVAVVAALAVVVFRRALRPGRGAPPRMAA